MARIELPEKLWELFAPAHGKLRWRGAHGGRGSGKSFNFAVMAAIRGYETRRRILATRDIQASIRESFHAELRGAIAAYPWLQSHYRITNEGIYGANGTEFIFRGLRHNIEAIRSLAQIDICIVEEAEDLSEKSWRQLVPTVRSPHSEFWVIWNPLLDGSPVDKRLRKHPPPRSMVVEMNHTDNPWFPPELEEQRLHDQEVLDPETYAHIWEGAYLENTEAQVLASKWRIARFEPGDDWDGPYHGLDFGFSQDPTAATRCWIHDGRLFVEREAGKVRLELDDTADYLKQRIPGIEKYEVLADSARPESISHLRKPDKLPRIAAAKKWGGSVQDGISFLRSFREIVIHERCIETKREARLYSHKVDRLSGQVLEGIVDAHNHYIDSIRYGLDKVIRRKGVTFGNIGSAQ
jgi:phage terminase large subunit